MMWMGTAEFLFYVLTTLAILYGTYLFLTRNWNKPCEDCKKEDRLKMHNERDREATNAELLATSEEETTEAETDDDIY
jgi:hypothetical protein